MKKSLACLLLLSLIVGCGKSEPAQKATEPGTCTINYAPEASKSLGMGIGNREAWAFGYKGASIQLTLELFHQVLPADEVKPGPERLKLIGKPTDNDRIVRWASIDHKVIETFEAGDLSKEDVDALGINVTEGKIVFQLPDWNHDHRTGYVSHDGVSRTSFKLPDPGESAFKGKTGSFNPGDPKRTTLNPGQTGVLAAGHYHSEFADGRLHRIDYVLKARCLRDPE